MFRALALTLIPLSFLLLLELALRFADYGHPTAYFIRTTVKDRVVWAGNQQFTLRFFPIALARELDRPMVSASKPAGTLRIFVLGDSAAQGDPAPAFAFSRALDVMLRGRYPALRFEVVNTAVTAINSHVILPIAEECARLEPDFFVVYMGNNEVIGPYGPATVFTSASQNLTLMRASIALKSTRTGQFMDSFVKGSGTAKPPDAWGGMAMFLGNRIRHDDPRMEPVYDHFRKNLRDMTNAGLKAGARVIICTLGVNLKDCPPFASMSRTDLAGSELMRWKSAYDDGVTAESHAQPEPAIRAYEAACTIDDSFADLHFRLGRCHAALGHDAQALAEFSLARDLDALPFRATSRTIGIMREIGTNHEAEKIHLADVAHAFELDSAHGLPGDSIFHEHVHMTFHGNYLAARTVLEQVDHALGQATPGHIASESECADALGYSAWEQLRVANEIFGRIRNPPFIDQLDHADNVRRLEADIARLRSSEQPQALVTAEVAYRAALQRQPDDWRLREVFARFLIEGRNDAANAVGQFRQILGVIPFDYHAEHNLAIALRDDKKPDEAIIHFQESLRLKPDYTEALCALGAMAIAQKHYDEAQSFFAKALSYQPANVQAHAGLGDLSEAQEHFDDALVHFSEAHYTPAQMGMAHNRFGIAMAKAGKIDAAEPLFRKSIALQPDYADAHFNLGNLLSRKGDKDAALKCLAEAVRLKPDLAEAHAQIGAILLAKHQTDRAIESYRAALKLKPELATAENALGVALASQGRISEAIEHFSDAVRLRPDMVDARQNLEHARAALTAPR